MELEQARKRAAELRAVIEKNNRLYYDQDAPELEDYEYDQLTRELKTIEAQFPQLVTPDSPTQHVGGTPSGKFSKVAHAVKMESPQDAFLIYQIRRGGELDAYRFMNYDYLQSKGVTPERGGYDAIYTGGVMDYGNARTNLDMIYQRFNVNHPADFKGHSLSVSDIVALKQNGVVSCHYVDSIGFRELPNFLKPENYLKNAEMAMEDDYGMIDGIINNGPKQPTVADLEAQVKAGFSISLTELAAASHREQKKPSVLEKLRERTPEQTKNKTAPKRSAEREL